MPMILDKPQLKEAHYNLQEQRLVRIKTVFKFVCLLVLCLMIIAPWLTALFSQIKG